jgi:hypothetical protein
VIPVIDLKAEETFDAKLTDLHGYGVVALCEAVGWGRPLIPRVLIVDEEITGTATARLLFPS